MNEYRVIKFVIKTMHLKGPIYLSWLGTTLKLVLIIIDHFTKWFKVSAKYLSYIYLFLKMKFTIFFTSSCSAKWQNLWTLDLIFSVWCHKCISAINKNLPCHSSWNKHYAFHWKSKFLEKKCSSQLSFITFFKPNCANSCCLECCNITTLYY